MAVNQTNDAPVAKKAPRTRKRTKKKKATAAGTEVATATEVMGNDGAEVATAARKAPPRAAAREAGDTTSKAPAAKKRRRGGAKKKATRSTQATESEGEVEEPFADAEASAATDGRAARTREEPPPSRTEEREAADSDEPAHTGAPEERGTVASPTAPGRKRARRRGRHKKVRAADPPASSAVPVASAGIASNAVSPTAVAAAEPVTRGRGASPLRLAADPSAATAEGRLGRRRRGRRGRRRGHDDDEAPRDETVEPVRIAEIGEGEDDEAIDAEFWEREPATARAPSGALDVEEEDDAELEGTGTREMLINVSAGDEKRIAILHEGRLEELFLERESTQSHVGNIYKGRITNVESSIQAAFVDFGLPKNGFLHISDVQPQYFRGGDSGRTEDVGRKIPRHHRPPIQECFRRGQEVIVQVTKEGVGTKGPTLTTYLSIPGRFLVMMPGMNKLGVSRKIEDDAARRQMRDVLNQLELPGGMGFILRTAGMGRTKRELQRDLNYLMRLWRTVVNRIKTLHAPAELYRESDLVIRTIRDVYTSDFRRVLVDDAETAEKAGEFLRIAMPRSKALVELYTDREPLFHRHGIEAEIERLNMRQVPLPSGGSIVIDSTEALVAIDVNSGRFRSPDDAEETALRINMEASDEIARQLRLRDLGGLIVCDFIDMRYERNKRAVERAMRDALKKHKERARILRMSAFGLIEITRQRRGPSMKRSMFFECPHCKGSGLVKTPASVVLDVMRIIQLAAHRETVQAINVSVAPDVAYEILNKKRTIINEIETETAKLVILRGDPNCRSDEIICVCEDRDGRPVPFSPFPSQEPPTNKVRR
jgi:ribonuclease E